MIKLLIDTQALILPGILLALVVISLVYNMSKRSKYQRETTDLEENLQVGDKVKTYAGIYGVVESIREALDGSKIVLIKSGEGDKVSYYSIDIAAIYSLDFKDEEEKDEEDNENKENGTDNEIPKVEEVSEEIIVEEVQEEPKVEIQEEVDEQPVEVEVKEVTEEVKEPKTTKKTTSTSKKASTTKKTTASKTKKDK